MVRTVRRTGAVSPSAVIHPIQTLDFDQVQVLIQIAPLTPDNYNDFLRFEEGRIRELLSNQDAEFPRRAVLVLDGTGQLMTSPSVRMQQADWMRANVHLLHTLVHAMAVVLPSPLARGAFTAVNWLVGARPPWRVLIHRELRSAISWAVQEVHAMGGSVAPELVLAGARAVECRREQLLAARRR